MTEDLHYQLNESYTRGYNDGLSEAVKALHKQRATSEELGRDVNELWVAIATIEHILAEK